MHSARFIIPFDSDDQAKVVMDAVALEAADGPDGTTTDLELVGGLLNVDLLAEDLAGLRRAVHSILRLLETARRVSA